MNITTVHSLAFTIRAHNGKHQLAENIINAAAESLRVNIAEVKALPLPNGEDTVVRNSQVQVCCADREQLELYWNQLQSALALVGVEATSP